MASGSLTALQERVVEILQDIDPAWTLTGGGALAAVHLQHRTTRDLDLCWHGRCLLDGLPEEVEERRDSGFSALTLAWVLQQLDVQGLGRSGGSWRTALPRPARRW